MSQTTEIVFDDLQTQAIELCCNVDHRLVAITGKAGTGKTLIIREVYDQLTRAGYSVACSAPTGKAAKRIQESTGIPALTNHRLLGYGMPIELKDEDTQEVKRVSTGPSYNRNRPLIYDVILADEYAMVNHEIHTALTSAIKPGGLLRMFGDVNQLKPIEENKFLSERPTAFQSALAGKNSITLERIHRQSEGSGIADNGARILRGSIPTKRTDFNIIFTDQPVNVLKDLVFESLDKGIDFSTPEHQIITIMNKTWVGTQRLNVMLQTLFWKNGEDYMELPRRKFRTAKEEIPPIRVQVGTKVIYTANTYDLGNGNSVFNGETGNIVEISDDGSVLIDFMDRVESVPPLIITTNKNGDYIEIDPRTNIDLAYAVTTHKCQGSEYKNVVYVLNRSTSFMQNRANFYTGITRAREYCTVITDQVSIHKSSKQAG